MSSQLMLDGWVQGAVTTLAFIGFLSVCVYAYGPWKRKDFEEAARLPLEEDSSDDKPEPKS